MIIKEYYIWCNLHYIWIYAVGTAVLNESRKKVPLENARLRGGRILSSYWRGPFRREKEIKSVCVGFLYYITVAESQFSVLSVGGGQCSSIQSSWVTCTFGSLAKLIGYLHTYGPHPHYSTLFLTCHLFTDKCHFITSFQYSQMASSSSSSSFSSFNSKSPPPLLPSRLSPQFTPIQEEHEVEGFSEERRQSRSTPSDKVLTPKQHQQHHPPTPIVNKNNGKWNQKKKRSESEEDGSVSCNKCRPHSRDKIFVLPFDHNNNNGHTNNKHSSLLASPNGIFRSIVSRLTRKSPMSSSAESVPTTGEEQWKMAVAELSHKLVQATRKRDEALLEASRLMHSMSELENKLNKLELYCHTLKSGLEECSSSSNASPLGIGKPQNDTVVRHFLLSVSEARSCVRLLSRSLTMQLRHMGSKVYEKVSFLLQPYDIKISFSKSPRTLLFYLEALLNTAFFEDFETVGFQKNACNRILNPMERCEASFASFNMLHGLTWEEVLSKGTRHFSEDFSRFCDRKMSEIVAMLGWNRAWPEPLLQAFFGASKSVWMLHLLANSVHPSLPILRVEKGVSFDSVYMEDMGGDRSSNLVPSIVRIMVTPGFYVYGSAIKCKVLCRYFTNNSNKEHKPSLTPITP
ncbi:hypothetical protein VNO77_00115 [Canavalia gladiata]|uniref:IRK-interacting protein n=1 Tax=Canavalia gladiata TaxID=3824 RepID=A0AAN9R443_CANGL